MATTITSTWSNRDLAILRAVAAGRCETSGEFAGSLVVDGLCVSDQFSGRRLTQAGLIAAPVRGPVELPSSGRALINAA